MSALSVVDKVSDQFCGCDGGVLDSRRLAWKVKVEWMFGL